MIVSVSRRTDVPAFYGKWFLNRVRAGFCLVRNPLNPQISTRVELQPDAVDCIVFWTRHAGAFRPHLVEIQQRGFAFYFLYTLTSYGRDLEPYLPEKSQRVRDFRLLSEVVGPERLIWRYDPIVISRRYSFDWHLTEFNQLAGELHGWTQRVVISFADFYRKTRANLARTGDHYVADPVQSGGIGEFLHRLREIAALWRMEIFSCAERPEVAEAGIQPGKCIDDDLISHITGRSIRYKKDPSQRPACRCTISRDIGTYGSCPFACRYCYATSSRSQALKFFKRHDPDLPFLG